MKKQDALMASSSSSHRENSPEKNLHANTIGCMSGFFHLVFNYNNRRRHRKFLTYGKKQEKKMREVGHVVNSCEETENKSMMTRLSCDVDRSPMLGADIRRSSKSSSVKSASESAAEKRKKLVEALGKCDEDLKALKKMIEVVKMNSSINNINNNTELQQPSPVSVLQYSLTLTPPSPFTAYTTQGGAIPQPKLQKQKKKPGEDHEIISNISLVDRIMKTDDVEQIDQAKQPFWISKGMIDSVNEVCRDISWGERREIGRIGLALQDFIFRDLIEESVRELMGCFSSAIYSLPFDACKRQLVF